MGSCSTEGVVAIHWLSDVAGVGPGGHGGVVGASYGCSLW